MVPEHRRRGVARALLTAALDCCRAMGCSAAGVTITALGEEAHGLGAFYARLGFQMMDRKSAVLRF